MCLCAKLLTDCFDRILNHNPGILVYCVRAFSVKIRDYKTYKKC